MSLQSLTESHTCVIKRKVHTRARAGGRTFVYTTAARGTLPISVKCLALVDKATERLEYGTRGTVIIWKILSTTNPRVDTRDRFELTDLDGVVHQINVTVKSHWVDPRQRLYRAFGEEDTTTT